MFRIALIIIIAIGLLTPTLFAEENWYFRVDSELQGLYEYYMGISLKDAIDLLNYQQSIPIPGKGDIYIRVNGNCSKELYIGMNNTIEIMIRNDISLEMMVMQFLFSSSADSSKYHWVAGYGTITPDNGPEKMIKIHSEPFDGDLNNWQTTAELSDNGQRLEIRGEQEVVAVKDSQQCVLTRNTRSKTIYSMQLYIGNDYSIIGEDFFISVGNEEHHPLLLMAQIAPYGPGKFSFQGIRCIDDKPGCIIRDTFEITRCITCDSGLVVRKQGKEYLRDRFEEIKHYSEGLNNITRKKRDNSFYDNFMGLSYLNYTRMVTAKIDYEGNKNELMNIGADILFGGYWNSELTICFPLKILPELCQLEGVKSVNSLSQLGGRIGPHSVER